MEITRRTALALLGAVAVPSAAAVAVAAAQPPRPMTIEEFLAIATPAEKVRYHSNQLREALEEMHPEWMWRAQIDHGAHFAFFYADFQCGESLAREEGPMTTPSLVSRKISDVEDLLLAVRCLNDAVFMAATGIGDRHNCDAIQAVADEINSKLLVVRDRLEEIREELK
jgi:hypothetical protein